MRIFISYRRGDAGGHAGRLADALRGRLGRKGVFQDVTAIAPGEDFAAAIDRALDQCDAVLAVIGRSWEDATTPDGAPRLRQRGDYVRLELARALARSVPVVPVLVGGASLPRADELPEELRGLVQRQAVVLHDETWHEDVDGLLRGLRGELEPPSHGQRRRIIAAVAAAAVVAAGAAAWLVTGADDPSASDEGGPPSACAAQTGKAWHAIELAGKPRLWVENPDLPVAYGVERAHWRERDGHWEVVLATTMENLSDEPFYNGDYHYPSLIVGKREFPQTCYAENPGLVAARTIGDAVVGFEVRCEPTGHIELVTDGGRIDVTDPALEPAPC